MASWQATIVEPCSPPISASGRVFCPAKDLYAFDASTGRSLWTLASDSSLQLVEGVADAQRVFAASLTSVVAADAATGALLWKRSFSGPGWRGIRMRSLALTPDGDLLAAFEALYSDNGFFSAAAIVAVDPATGQERWRFQDGGPMTNRAIGGLTIWNDLILYSDAHGSETAAEMVAVDRTTRLVRWRSAAEPGFLGSLRAPVVVAGIAYWAAGDSHVYAADAATGEPIWSVEPRRGSFVSHEVCGPYVLANNFSLEIIDRASGQAIGRLFANERVGQTAVADGVAYVSTERGVYALDCGG